MIFIGSWGKMDYDLKILYPIKTLLYEGKRRHFGHVGPQKVPPIYSV